jgi:hypothetical protein
MADLDWLVRTVFGEAGNQSPEGQQAVAAVIINRLKELQKTNPKATIQDVVLAKNQFEPWQTRSKELLGLPETSPQYQGVASNVQPLLSGAAPDPTGGADHFLNPAIMKKRGGLPPWAAGQPGQDIGDHRFFKLGYGQSDKVAQATEETKANIAAAGAPPEGTAMPEQNGPDIEALLAGLIEKKLAQKQGGGGILGFLKSPQAADWLGAMGAGLGSKPGWGPGIGAGAAIYAGMDDEEDSRGADIETVLKLMQMQSQQRHNQAMETTAKQNADTSAASRNDLIENRARDDKRAEAKLTGPIRMITAASPQYAGAKAVLTKKQDWSDTGSWTRANTTGGGDVARAQNVIKTALTGAAEIAGVKPEVLFETMLPTSPEDAAEKLARFESYMAGIRGSLAESYPSQAKALEAVEFATPLEADTVVPKGGAPVEAGAAGAPAGATRFRFNPQTGELEPIQ